MAGPAKPPRLPIELMVAIPAAAAGPDRNMVGTLHSGGLHELMPILTSVSAASTAASPVAGAASARPNAANRHGITTCQVRSPVRSECRDHRIMTMTAAVGGMALRQPTSNDDSPNCLMICGAQMP